MELENRDELVARMSLFGKFAILLRLARLLKAHAGKTLLTILFGFGNHATAIAAAAMAAYIVGQAATGASVQELTGPFIWMGVLILARAALHWAEMYLAHDVAYLIIADMRHWAYRAIERFAPGGLLKMRSGNIAATVKSDMETTEWFFAHTFGTTIVAFGVPAVVLLLLAGIHPLLPLVLIPFLIAVLVAPFWLHNLAERQGRALREALGEMNAQLSDGLQGLREWMGFAQEERYIEQFDRLNGHYLKSQKRYAKRRGLEDAATLALAALGMVAALAMAGVLISRNEVDVALYPAIVVLAASVFGPVTDASVIFQKLGLMTVASLRIFDLLEKPAEVEFKTWKKPDSQPYDGKAPEIRFADVHFQYEDAVPYTLNNVSFPINAGETVALVGHSGAGKSTCTHLLMRFWDPTFGTIAIDGIDLREYAEAELRRMIAIVPQDIYLYNISIRDNIRLGKPEASDDEVAAAAKAASAHDFISELAEGYDTRAGERGHALSGGQRQRIAIARAILMNAPILVLDEAVSNLDTENEQHLKLSLDRLRAGRTTLMVAHRLSTIRTADRIVVLEQGRVIEQGTYEQLVGKKGAFFALIERATAGEIVLQE